MMDLNLRHAVIANVSGNSQEELEHTIVDAIQSGEEKCFRDWVCCSRSSGKDATESDKTEMLETLEQGLKAK